MYSWTSRLGKDVDFPLLIHRFNVIPIQIPKVFIDTEKIILKFIWKGKVTRTGKTILKKN